MPDYFSAQEIVTEAYSEDMWNTGVYKIAALKYIQKNVSVLETLGEKTDGLGPDDPVEITYGELDSIMGVHVANIYLALTSEAFRNSRFADEEAHVGKGILMKEVQGVLKEMQEQQEAEK